MTTSYRYDSVGNLVEQVTHGESEIAFSYAYDRNGYITGEIRRENGTTVAGSYAYDAAGQLTEFLQTTGYGERYAYDRAGNMTEKVLTGTDGAETTLAMKYNKGNQLTGMANGRDKIAYTYDRNGSMVQKVLSSQTYGKLTDSYAYNALDQLTDYVGYDGYRQAFTYDANGMRQSKSEAGDANRSTLEELLRGNVAGLPEIVEPAQSQTNADVPAGLEWATTEYLYDLTQEYYQVISETTTYANGTSATTAYAYGLERIAAYSENGVTRYVYDGRGSVAQTVNVPVAGKAVSSNLPDVGVQVQTFSYTAYGEQMGGVKVSGFTYNAEAYDAATGMLNLRARQYEPAVGRFSGKDMMRGYTMLTISIHRYLYTYNNPINWIDPDGMRPADKDEAKLYFSSMRSSSSTKTKSTNIGQKANNKSIFSGSSPVPLPSPTTPPLPFGLKTHKYYSPTTDLLREKAISGNAKQNSSGNAHATKAQTSKPVISTQDTPKTISTSGEAFRSLENYQQVVNRKGGQEWLPVPSDSLSAFRNAKNDYSPKRLILTIPKLYQNDYDYPATAIISYSYSSQVRMYPSDAESFIIDATSLISDTSGPLSEGIEFLALYLGFNVPANMVDAGISLMTEYIASQFPIEPPHLYKEGYIIMTVEGGMARRTLYYSFTTCSLHNCSLHRQGVHQIGN